MAPRIFIEVVLLFYVYAFIGWLWETGLYLVKDHKFVARGFLMGPIIPIYGFGVVSVLYLLRPWFNNLVVLYIAATILVTALEFITGYGLEKIFHTKWWNYDKVPLNIGGYVALPVSLFWGVACVFIVEVVQPRVMILVDWAGNRFGILLPVILIALTSFDFGFTLANLTSFRERMNKLNAVVDEHKQKLSKDVGQIKTDWKAIFKQNPQLPQQVSNLSWGQRHLLNSFPNLKIDNNDTPVQDIKGLSQALKQQKQSK